jgi:hypothetical protein
LPGIHLSKPAAHPPIAAPLERCAELLGVDLATIGVAAANIEPYVRADGVRIWSLMQPERQLRPRRRAGGAAAIPTADGPGPPAQRTDDSVGRQARYSSWATARGVTKTAKPSLGGRPSSRPADGSKPRWWLSEGRAHAREHT